MENSEANRQKWRNLLFTTPGINQYVSGAILFEETLFQNDPDGKPFVDVMKVRELSSAFQPEPPVTLPCTPLLTFRAPRLPVRPTLTL